MKKVLTVAVIGLGGRGNAYANNIVNHPDEFKLVACCDLNQDRINNYKEKFGIEDKNCFLSEEEFFAEKRADVCIVATQDRDHVDHAIKALALGYDILTEKPISDNEKDCRRLLKAQKKYGGKVFVCHVLRYAPAFVKCKELLESGVIGDLVMVDHIEQVYFFHQAHSFVRGNWRRRDQTSPMIIAKCCHDLDLLQWYIGSKCKTISSIGDLRFFKKENKPEGSADRCTECQFKETCPYSAVWGYRCENGLWSNNAITDVRPITQEAVDEALKTGPYGRCVFACDNNVVDNQICTMTFENGVTANLRMTAFTRHGSRIIKFYGTYGEIDFEGDRQEILVKVFGKPVERIDAAALIENGYGHGGGDAGLIKALYGLMTGESNKGTTLEASIESHLMGFAAEKSRLKGGKVIKIKH